VKIRNPKLLDGAQEPEPEHIGRTMRVLNLTKGLRVTEADIRLSVGCDSNKLRAATEQRFMRTLAFLQSVVSEVNGHIFSDCCFHDMTQVNPLS
jgi:hypothetical protein